MVHRLILMSKEGLIATLAKSCKRRFLTLYARLRAVGDIGVPSTDQRAIVKSCVWADHAAARSWRSPSTNLTPRMISPYTTFDNSSLVGTREVLSKQSIGVLVRSALPRAVRFAEVDGKAGCDPQIRMPGHLCSLVPGQRAAKRRWQCRDRPGDGIANRFSPMTGKRRPVLHARDGAVAFHSGKMQQHCEPRGAFHQSADRRSAQADDQVTFPVSGYGPISCFRMSRTRFPWTQNWLNRSVQGGPEHDR